MRVKWYQRKENTMPTTQQPIWKLLANLGDVHPLDYGGYFVYQDETGVYEAEGELLEERQSDEKRYTIYRFSLDRCTYIDGVLSDNKYHTEHAAWFAKNLSGMASYVDMTELELINQFCSNDPIERANAYRVVGDYNGYTNLDSYPLQLTRKEAQERYREFR